MTPTIDVWLFGLDRPPAELAALAETLAPDERDKAARFVRDRDRDRYTVARGVMRHIVGAATGRPAAALTFAYNAHGKPYLPGAGEPQFNLSHSGDLGALGIGWTIPFGVDIEQMKPIEQGVADISFSAAELRELAACAEPDWLPSFFRCWTRKEAVIKALGLGLAQPLDAFDVTLGPGVEPRLLRLEGVPEASAQWRLTHFSPAEGYMGAVAVPAPGHVIGFKRWNPGVETPASRQPLSGAPRR